MYCMAFCRGVNLQNPTKDLILLSISGAMTLVPGGDITPKFYSYIKNEPSLLIGNGADIASVVEGEDKTHCVRTVIETDVKFV